MKTFQEWLENDWPHILVQIGRLDERVKANARIIWCLVIPLLLSILGVSVYFGAF